MKKVSVFKYIVVLLLNMQFFNVSGQDLNIIELGIGGGQNVSLFRNKITHFTANVQLGYQVNRNVTGGILYQYGQGYNEIALKPSGFTAGVNLPGDSTSFKESINFTYAGVYGLYRFLPISSVSINLMCAFAQATLSRSTTKPDDLNNDAMTYYQDIWPAAEAFCIGLGLGFDFNFNRKIALRLGFWQRDITGALTADKDPNFASGISYADSKIENIQFYKNAFNGLETNASLLFKIGKRK